MRRNYALADVFGRSFSNEFEDQNHGALLTNPENGCILIPGEWGLETKDGAPACRIPGDRIVSAIRRAVPVEQMPAIYSPLPHVEVSVRQTADGRRCIGLFNLADQPVKEIEIICRLSDDNQASEVTLLDTITVS